VESRVGIGIDQNTRTTSNAQLYMASHIRLQPGVRLYVALNRWTGSDFAKALRPLAGEHRMALIEQGEAVALPDAPACLPGGRYCVIQISPMVLKTMPKPGASLEGLPGKLVSACLGKSVPIGGWDSNAKKPLPLRLAVPAGSVWFMQCDDRNEHITVPETGIGIGAAWGFGQILVGRWQGENA
jgi:CRISPR-associated protein Cmr3